MKGILSSINYNGSSFQRNKLKCNKLLSLLFIIKKIITIFSFFLITTFQALAICTTVSKTGNVDGALTYANDFYIRETNLPATINIDSEDLQPNGILLASTIISADISNRTSPEQLIYLCDLSDAGKMQFAYISNAAGLYGGGYWLNSSTNGMVKNKYNGGASGVFQTMAKNVALRLSISGGESFSGVWKLLPLTSANYEEYEYNGEKKIAIKAKHIPMVTMELFKVGAPANLSLSNCQTADGPTNSKEMNCEVAKQDEVEGNIVGVVNNGKIVYSQAAGFVTLKAPGFNDNIVAGSTGSLRTRTKFAVGYGINNMIRLTRQRSCIVRNVTPFVYFSTISVGELMSGQTREEDFDIEIKCHGTGVKYGFGEFDTAMGIRISLDSYKAAIDEKLIANGGSASRPPVTHLLSNRYQTNDSTLAKGVGIRITLGGRPVKLMGYDGLEVAREDEHTPGFSPYPSEYHRLGESGGWLSVTRNADISNEGDYKIYHHRFTSILERLPGKQVTTGKIEATAYVVVQVQ